MKHTRSAFTLVEVMLAITIAVLVMSLFVPAITSIFADDPLEKTFRDFDQFVRDAQNQARNEQRDFLMVWEKGGVSLEPRILSAEDENVEFSKYPVVDATLAIKRFAALDEKPSGEWPIWKSGIGEPVRITYESDLGSWTAEYDALTLRAKVIAMDRK